MSGTLRVRAAGTALVASLEHPKANPRVFVGRLWSEQNGTTFLVDAPEPSELPVRAEYLRALREGALLPADKFTADMAGVAFDPNPKAEPAPPTTKED